MDIETKLKTDCYYLYSNLSEGKGRGKNKNAANNSMDVRAKQLLSYERCSLAFRVRVAGFRPRQFNRCGTLTEHSTINHKLFKNVTSAAYLAGTKK